MDTSSELQSQPSSTPIEPIADNPPPAAPKDFTLPLVFGVIALILLIITAYLLRQNQQLKRQLVQAQPVPTTVPISPTPGASGMATPTPPSTGKPTPTPKPSPTPSPTPTPTTTTVTIKKVAGQDGYVSNDGDEINTNNTINIGRHQNPARLYRGFVGFDLGELQKRAHIVTAILRMYQLGMEGNPFISEGPLLVDHVDYGTTLNASDYSATPITSNIGVLATDPSGQDSFAAWKQLDVTSNVTWDLARHISSQFRFRMTTEVPGENAVVSFDSNVSPNTGSPSSTSPQLVITYY